MMAKRGSENESKKPLGTIAIFVGWGLTILAVIWQVAMKDAGYSHRLDQVEEEIVEVSVRLNDTEQFRVLIVEQLAEIKTDLSWIKQRLDELKTR